MGLGHRYELVGEGEDKEGDVIKQQPQRIYTPVITSWWKLLLCNLLAATVGAGVMFLIARGSNTTTVSAPASTATNAALNIATSTALAASATAPSTPVKQLDVDVDVDDLGADPTNSLAGKILDCGGSPADARAKGCVYDVMMQDWVPEPCYDAILTEKYLAKGNWTWYADNDNRTIISLEDMRKGEHGAAWMATSYHHAHCVFSWVKIIRALRNNRGISQELLSYDHVMHCSHGALTQSPDDEGVTVRAPTNYAKCALYDTWMQNLLPDKHNSTQRR